MTIVNPAAADALREIELPRGTLLTGNGRGVPMRRYSMLDSTLLLVAVQSIVISALLPIENDVKLGLMAAGLVLTVVAAVIGRRRALHSQAVRTERAAIIRWLAIHTSLEHRSRLALAWAEPQEIGESQYEFRTLFEGRSLSLIIDLDIQVASLASI